MMFDVVEGFGKSIAKSRTALLHGYPYAPEWYDASLIDAFMQLPKVKGRFPFQESRISAIVNVCLRCGNAIFRTGNLLLRSFYWRKREDTVRQPDLFFCVSVCFRYCVNTTRKFHICRNQVFQWEFFFVLT